MEQCGDLDLSGLLLSGVIQIDNIAPNPSTGSVVVSVSSGARSPVPAQLDIVDALGRTVCEQKLLISAGQINYFPLNLENIPSGAYGARLSGVGVASTREFIKE